MDIRLPERWFSNDFLLWCSFYLHDDADDNPPEHVHNDFYELVLVTHGEAIHILNGEEEPVGQGNIIFIAPGEKHHYKKARQLGVYNVVFDAELFNVISHYCNTMNGYKMIFGPKNSKAGIRNNIFQISHPHWPEVLQEAVAIANAFAERNVGFRTMMLGAFFKLTYNVCKYCQLAASIDYVISDKISRAINYMKKKLDEQLTLEQIAACAGMGVSSFRKHFRTIMGVPPIEYLLQLRLRSAREMLITSCMHVDEIAYANGFVYSNYFSRQFKKHYGILPTVYRSIHAAQTSDECKKISARYQEELKWISFNWTDKK